jgi:hypothetical protein
MVRTEEYYQSMTACNCMADRVCAWKGGSCPLEWEREQEQERTGERGKRESEGSVWLDLPVLRVRRGRC